MAGLFDPGGDGSGDVTLRGGHSAGGDAATGLLHGVLRSALTAALEDRGHGYSPMRVRPAVSSSPNIKFRH